MATRAQSISISKLSSAAHEAAKAALTKVKLPVAAEPGIIIDNHWIIGIILRNPDLQHLGQYQQVASHITDSLSKVAINPQPLPPKESASLYWTDHVIICGYRPAPVESLNTVE